MKALEISGWMLAEELQWLAEQAANSNVIIEIGTWKGRSAAVLAENTCGVVFCIDHFWGSADEQEFFVEAATAAGREAVKQECLKNLDEWIAAGRLFVIDLDVQAALGSLRSILASRPADMVFIDGGHSYEQVRQDLLAAQGILRNDGLLCGHDSNREGIARALNELVPGWKHGPGLLWYK